MSMKERQEESERGLENEREQMAGENKQHQDSQEGKRCWLRMERDTKGGEKRQQGRQFHH